MTSHAMTNAITNTANGQMGELKPDFMSYNEANMSCRERERA